LDPRAGLDDVEKKKFLTLPGLELRSLGRPARSHSLGPVVGVYEYGREIWGFKRGQLFIDCLRKYRISMETLCYEVNNLAN
jgi:hypothetical protein